MQLRHTCKLLDCGGGPSSFNWSSCLLQEEFFPGSLFSEDKTHSVGPRLARRKLSAHSQSSINSPDTDRKMKTVKIVRKGRKRDGREILSRLAKKGRRISRMQKIDLHNFFFFFLRKKDAASRIHKMSVSEVSLISG